MGSYDTYGKRKVQLKIGECISAHYSLGEKVKISDGVYVGHEGVVVVKGGKLAAEFDCATDKWGNKLRNSNVIDCNDAIQRAVRRTLAYGALTSILDKIEELGMLPLFVGVQNKAVVGEIEKRFKQDEKLKSFGEGNPGGIK